MSVITEPVEHTDDKGKKFAVMSHRHVDEATAAALTDHLEAFKAAFAAANDTDAPYPTGKFASGVADIEAAIAWLATPFTPQEG